MKALLLKFSWFRNWLADVWENGFNEGESWDKSGGLGTDAPRNPYVRGVFPVGGGIEEE